MLNDCIAQKKQHRSFIHHRFFLLRRLVHRHLDAYCRILCFLSFFFLSYHLIVVRPPRKTNLFSDRNANDESNERSLSIAANIGSMRINLVSKQKTTKKFGQENEYVGQNETFNWTDSLSSSTGTRRKFFSRSLTDLKSMCVQMFRTERKSSPTVSLT